MRTFVFHTPPRPRLWAETVPVRRLKAATVDDTFALFQEGYEGADRARFLADLAEKHWIVLLRDRDTGALRGFSTVWVGEEESGTVVFSGDTVIDRAYWGQKRLQSEFARLLLRYKLRRPGRPLFWFLISKGYRTYLLLANAFPRAVPRHDHPDDPRLRAILDRLVAERFGAQYDATAGTIRYAIAHERVREGVAPVNQALLRNPHVRFFLDRNPGHADGDELACLAEVRLRDLAHAAARIAAARLRWKARG